MRRATAWKRAVIAALIITLPIGFTGTVQAQQPTTITFTVTENRVPGATGTGTITPLPDNQIRVDVRLTGMPPNEERAMHIHIADGARCDTNAPIVYPLNSVRVDGSGVGTSSTPAVTLRPDQPVRGGNAYINIHVNPTVPPPSLGIICANIDATFAVGQPAMPTAVPRTGVGLIADTALSGWSIALLGALAVLLGGAGAAVAIRRR